MCQGDNMKLAENMKKYRKKLDWSQQKLAEKAGLSYNAITKIEQESAQQPTIQTVWKIADAFEITIDELIGRKKE